MQGLQAAGQVIVSSLSPSILTVYIALERVGACESCKPQKAFETCELFYILNHDGWPSVWKYFYLVDFATKQEQTNG